MSGVITRGAPWRHQLSDHVSALAWAPDGDIVAAGSLGGDVAVLAAMDGELVGAPSAHPMGVLALAWSNNGILAVGGQDGRLCLCDVALGHEQELALGGWVNTLAWSPTADTLAVGVGRRLLVVEQGSVVSEVELVSTVTSLVWSTDGRRLGAGCYGGVHWLDRDDGWLESKHYDWRGSVLSLAMAPDGRWLAGGSQDATVQIWKLWSAEHLEMSGYPAKIQLLAWDPTSHWFANSCLESITVWDCSGKGPKGRRPDNLEGHEGRVTGLAFSGEALLASGSADGRLALWAHRRKWREVGCAVIEGGISTLAWAAPGPLLAVGTDIGRVEIFWASDLIELP
jgi:WD40 repeat protein